MTSLSRVIITTGGTCGHIFPALTVAAEIRRRAPQCAILFLGGNGPEGELAARYGLEFKALPAAGLLGGGVKAALKGVSWVSRGLVRAVGELRRFNPQVVIGFGGYAGFCPVLAAWLLGIPNAVHEQNSVPGMTNRVLSRVTGQVFTSFDPTPFLRSGRALCTGNPVRESIARVGEEREGRTPGRHILVVGGSQGAEAINNAVIQALPKFLEAGATLTHQAGAANADRVRRAYEQAGADPAWVHGFMDDMDAAYRDADLAVCRAGASTVFELAAAGLPAVFVPFPHATHDHQTHNAKALENIGAALLMAQDQLDGQGLAETVIRLLDSPERLTEMQRASREFARPEAAGDIARSLETLAAQAA